MHKNIAWLLASVKLGFLVCFSLMGAAEVFAQSEAMVEIQYPCHQQSMESPAAPEAPCPICLEAEDLWARDFVQASTTVEPEKTVALLSSPLPDGFFVVPHFERRIPRFDPDPHPLQCVRSVVLRL